MKSINMEMENLSEKKKKLSEMKTLEALKAIERTQGGGSDVEGRLRGENVKLLMIYWENLQRQQVGKTHYAWETYEKYSVDQENSFS